MGLIFDKQFDSNLRGAVAGVALLLLGAGGLVAFLTYPPRMETGYMPRQPVPYSHKLHAGNLGMDCRYCHSTVERSGYAAIPGTQVCMNCHTKVKDKSPSLKPVRESYASGKPVEWIKVHWLPDYVFFNHSVHVSSGVSCVSCHGRVDQMVEVRQVEPLTMAWCLDCHRDPAARIRPTELVTKLDWKPERDPAEIGRELIAQKNLRPPTNCSGCHR